MNSAESAAPLLGCPACGAILRAQSRFCDACGHNLAAAVPGSLPLALVAAAAANRATPHPARRPMGLVNRLVRLAVICGVLAALSFITIPVAQPRAITVIALSAISGFSGLCLLAIVVVRGIRGRRRRSWAVAAVVVAAIQVFLVDGLNVFADSKATSATALVQDSYAEVGASVSLGDAIQQGRAPSGITFANVQTQASAASSRLTNLDVPAQLADYTSSVKAWADDVVAAAIKAQAGSPWHDVPYTPSPFQVDMTAGQAGAAYATSLQQIAILIQFGDRAVAVQDLAAMRYVGARLNAQSYWLEGIYTSADPNVVAAQLHFIEPVNAAATRAATSGGVVADGDREVRLLASIWRRGSWRPPRRVRFCFINLVGRSLCLPQVRGPLGALWGSMNHAALACAAAGGKFNGACTMPTPWPTARDELVRMLNLSGAQPIGGAGAGVATGGDVVLLRQQAFYDECHAQGGTRGSPTFVTERMPTTEDGWGCQIGRCWTYLTHSGVEYKGGEPGCPEQGLMPRPFGPLGALSARLGAFLPSLTPLSLGQSSTSWDGTYSLPPSTENPNCLGTTTPEGQDYIRGLLHQATSGPGGVLVSGESVVGLRTVPIDASGHARYTYPMAAFGSLTVDYSFTRDPSGVAHVKETVDVAATHSLAGGGFHCYVSSSGTRG